MEQDSYMFLIDMLTDEQKAKMMKMAKKYKYNAYLVRVNRGEKSSAIVES